MVNFCQINTELFMALDLCYNFFSRRYLEHLFASNFVKEFISGRCGLVL